MEIRRHHVVQSVATHSREFIRQRRPAAPRPFSVVIHAAIAARRTAICTLVLVASLPAAANAQTCVTDTTPDWMASSNSSASVRPADCGNVEQTPPDFSWPDLSSDAQYDVALTYPDGLTRTLTVPQNWINWDEVLPAGNYTWQVQVTNANGTQVSRARRFTVDAGAVPFVVPDSSTLLDRATTKAHSRALPDATTLQTTLNQTQNGLARLLSNVDNKLNDDVQEEPTFTAPKGWITAKTNDECKRTLNAAFAWVATNKEEYFVDALRRALNLAAWNPDGATAYAKVDEASRQIAWTLSLSYDWLFARLDVNQRNLLLAPIQARVTDMYNDLIGSRARVAIHPYDSHGNHTLTYLAAVSVVLAGDVPEAANWLRDALPLAIHWTSPWGGEDGGFANGTAYATWVTGDALLAWYTLRWVVGVDLGQKAWGRNYAQFLAYFIPPGTPLGAFGDGAERVLTENWARFGKAYTRFAPTPLGRWYASQLTGEDSARLELLLAPPADPSPAPYPTGTPNAALFPSIGWVAMHSDLADPARTSAYFKSSPYGSFNHSHADQNSFVVNAGGQPLAIDSGYYDGYKTPHWWQWYKQTRAHNAITYDGGQGQFVFEQSGKLGPGTISRFEYQSDYDIVTGDATQAYGGAVKEATRSMVYLRPNLFLVYDKLASDLPRQWEWNIHAVNMINFVSDQKISISNNGSNLCVEMLAGPAMRFTQTDLFTADPQGTLPHQWHGTFSSVDLVGSAEFMALLDVGCTGTLADAAKSDGVWTVNVGARTVTINAYGAITVQ